MEKNVLLEKIGRLIRQERAKANLSQEKLGLEAGLDRSYIGGIERGERNMSMKILFKISKAMDVKPANLLEEIEIEDLQDNM